MSSPDSEYAKKGKGYYLCKTSNIKNTPLASASMVIFTIVQLVTLSLNTQLYASTLF